ncbi:S8 family serine peptidase [Brasilonema bromeliae]|uniref:Peptidase S8 and S53 subtilisin kexin sedolisin n=1 Tax=Brasilonema bromeliae SPC951 TaxID=385972 RepID=A0ABX1PE70_9CYAN|nr:S8 family serine peptidase [Brasilonema bromeliae]NMG22755.1 peptidase S8 and S53 subtilisin kexin sedolisin [Brasilonema bromeliae SPC951]
MSTTFSESSLETAKNLNTGVNPQIFSDTLNSGHSNFYSFNLKGRSSFNLDFEDLSANAHVDLIQDLDGNGVVDDGEVINSSVFSGAKPESINQTLDAGLYYIQISIDEALDTDYKLAVSATPIDYAGDFLENARQITLHSQAKNYSDWVSISDTNDYYKFTLKTTSDFKLGLSGLSEDAQVQLLDGNGNTSYHYVGITNESINRTLDPGTYYVRVNSYDNSETFYKLSLSATPVSTSETIPTPSDGGILTTISNGAQQLIASVITSVFPNSNTQYFKGTLRADNFTYQSTYNRTIYSGNGNVDYGSGGRDLLDLSAFSSTQATIKLADSTGGVMYNPGNGTRLFDTITLSNGKEILFEGIEAIKFADKTINLSVTPNDPLFGQQWNLHMMGVQSAWRFTTGSNNVLIGIEDTGLAGTTANLHPDFRALYTLPNNYLDEMSKFIAHGTEVQGVIAAASNNGVGMSGINWNSDVFHIDVMGGDAGDYDLVTATQALIDQAKSKSQRLAVNLSLTGGSSPQFEQLIANNLNTALFVVAAGNGNSNSLESPADLAKRYANVVAVGASWGVKDWNNNPTTPGTRISYQGGWGSNKGDGLTLMAPSEYLTTNAIKSSNGFTFDYDQRFNGTSAGVPNVTGVASLVWSLNSNLTATQIKTILSETAYDLGAPGYDTEYGYGFVNADAAARRAMALARGAA